MVGRGLWWGYGNYGGEVGEGLLCFEASNNQVVVYCDLVFRASGAFECDFVCRQIIAFSAHGVRRTRFLGVGNLEHIIEIHKKWGNSECGKVKIFEHT